MTVGRNDTRIRNQLCRNVVIAYSSTEAGTVTAVDDVSFDLQAGEILALVGESGCGKSATALALLRLISDPPGRIAGGQIRFRDKDLLLSDDATVRDIRGNRIAMIFQEPMTSLNPVYTVGKQVAEAVLAHQDISRRDAMDRAIELFRMVGIPAPEQRVHEYPHKLSGGMRQRVTIAIALAKKVQLEGEEVWMRFFDSRL